MEHPDDWQMLRNRFQLMGHYDDYAVHGELDKFSQNYFNRLKKRLQAYQAFLNREVCSRNMPAELALLPMIESTLDAEAVSPARAAGLWQLMPETARAYGLQVSEHHDERKELVQSTQAALSFLQALYRETNDWLLAIAAYNVGAGKINRALSHLDETPVDFWKLSLPGETRQFVARLLALSCVIMEPQQYGLTLPTLRPVHFRSGIQQYEPCIGCGNTPRKSEGIKPHNIHSQSLKHLYRENRRNHRNLISPSIEYAL